MGKLTEALQSKEQRHDASSNFAGVRIDLVREETKRLNCDVPAAIYKKLQLMAIQNDTTISAMVNVWLRELFNEN